MRRRDDRGDRGLAALERRRDVAVEQGGERLLSAPLRMLRGERFHPIEREGELEVKRLLRPERAVVIEDRDPFGRRPIIGVAPIDDAGDEPHDVRFRAAVAP